MKAQVVDKPWGYERILENNDKYCMKEIFCHGRGWSSGGRFHLHHKKDETFLVIMGTIYLEIFEYPNRIKHTLRKGDFIRIKPYTPHRFTAWARGGAFVEASTHDSPEDSYRISYEELMKKGGDLSEGESVQMSFMF